MSPFTYAQTLLKVDTTAVKDWPYVKDGAVISNNGKYCGYFLEPNALKESKPFKLILKSLDNEWKFSCNLRNENSFQFSEDSKYAYFLKDNALNVIRTGKGIISETKEVINFRLLKSKVTEYILYEDKNHNVVLEDQNLIKLKKFNDVKEYRFNAKSGILYLVLQTTGMVELISFDINLKKERVIFHNSTLIHGLVLDDLITNRLAFSDSFGKCYLYADKFGAKDIFFGKNNSILKGLTFIEAKKFQSNGKLLLLEFAEPELKQHNSSVNPVKIFNYQNPETYGVVEEASRERKKILFAYSLINDKLIRLEQPNEKLKSISEQGNYALILKRIESLNDYYWNKKATNLGYVLNLNSLEKIPFSSNYPHFNEMTQNGKHVVTQNDSGGDIYSLDTSTGLTTNLTGALPIPLEDHEGGDPEDKNSRSLDFFRFSDDMKSVIVYDRYDIWQINLSGIGKPINLTGGVGRKENIVFRFISGDYGAKSNYKKNMQVIITAFDEETKENGFFNLKLGDSGSLKKLVMGPYLYQAPVSNDVPNWQEPIKAKNANVWLIPRQSAQESRNLFITSDFKKFKLLSDVYPEKKYEWFTTELINFTTKDGVKLKAILYKPNNFDPNIKYPVLFNYYQGRQADKLNSYVFPRLTEQYYFNFPIMLARGYLVCLTETYQKTGETAHCLVDAIEGAADEISKRPYVDNKNFGASGGSFGGYGTNCLAALSKKFAALVSISGISDLVNQYGNYPGISPEIVENRQLGMGVSLGTDPERYLKNSPITFTKQVTTPVLIVNTLKDWNVNVQQGIEWFNSLRREGKIAWMLQYQENGHGIYRPENQKDLYLRMNQFFDHYLKGAPAPVWMTKVQSANDRGVKDGFEYDTEIKTPQPSQLLKVGN